jgi:uncharacterized protein YeaO (DUF488 family)
MPVVLKRAYHPAASSDGKRVLVERLWPRGLSKQACRISLWLKDVAPSHELRQWFHAHPSQWIGFRKRYLLELHTPEAGAALDTLYDLVAKSRKVTLVFASKDEEHNSAVVLKELIDGMRKPPSSSGPEKAAAMPSRMRARR